MFRGLLGFALIRIWTEGACRWCEGITILGILSQIFAILKQKQSTFVQK